MLAVALKKTCKPAYLSQAKQYAAKAITVYEDTIGNQCPQVRLAYELLAKLHILTGDILQAQQVLEDSGSENKVLIDGLQTLIGQNPGNVKQNQIELLK